MNLGKEFKSFAKSSSISSQTLDQYSNNIQNLTPYILEERELRASQIDVFSRLLMDRIIWLSGAVNQHMADIVQAQLLFLDSVDKKRDITLYVNSPGGSVMYGLGIVDVMNYISADVATINIGMAASMGSVILSSGQKGKRASLISSRVMLHHVSSGTQGVIDDQRISIMESEKYNYLLFKILAKNCGKTFEQVHDDSIRDLWFNSEEALEYGLIDEIIGLDKSSSMEDLMQGFDKYYDKYVLGRS
jgi:ATP-dependent Clp protease protease subunit